jgi:hypothetical protein
MLSVATAALLAGPAFADTTIDTSTKTALTTGDPWTTSVVTTAVGTANAGNIIIKSASTSGTTTAAAGSVAISTANIGAITVDSSNYVYDGGAISNDGVSSAAGILIDVSKNPNASGASFTNAAGTTITGAGVYIDNVSSLNVGGSGTTKTGIWLDSINGNGTYTGDIILASGSIVTLNGDSSSGVAVDRGATLKGNLSLGGTFTMTQATATSTANSSLYGVLMAGEVDGNIVLPAGGTMSIGGAGATGMSIQGTGVTGSLTIGGTLNTIGESASSSVTVSTNTANTVFPEAGSALVVSASVGNGIGILGPSFSGDTSVPSAGVSSSGTSPAVLINPGANTLYAATATPQTAPLTIGVFGDANDPGFSFYNRGTISAAPANNNNSALAMEILGNKAALPTILTGGFFNSGNISASASSSGTVANANGTLALFISQFTCLDNCTFDASGNSIAGWTDSSLAAKNAPDKYAFVNTAVSGGGSITASIAGTRGGSATAIEIGVGASVPSIYNSGKIAATATTTDATITNPLQAIAIQDLSGSLTSIYNTGTISATATTLDNANSCSGEAPTKTCTVAISLGGDTLTPSGSGVKITDQSTSTSSATITGDILFGTGDNQVLELYGTGPTHYATVTGNVSYGQGASGGDKLTIGSYGALAGTVTSIPGSGVKVDVQKYGVLSLANSATPLYATDFHIESYGILTLGVSRSLTSSGVVAADGSATLDANAQLGVAFNSFVPQGSNSQGYNNFVLITAPHNALIIDPGTINLYNASLQSNVSSGGALPYLFASADLAVEPNITNGKDALILHVTPKELGTGANQLPLTAGSLANRPLATAGGGTSTLFNLANAALMSDDALGSYMVNGIHNAAEAQKAYNSFAPNVTGGSRAILVSVTDQATGVVGARQRTLNMYGKQEGGTTLWGQEFFQMIKDPGQGAVDPNTTAKVQSGFKDHGFGFAMGIDGGSPKYGWYGGSFTFYAGDVGELTRNSHVNEQWYILSGYSVWRGNGLFFDSKIDAGFGHFDGKRFITLTANTNGTALSYTREADNTHVGTMISGGFKTGAIFAYGATTLSPELAVDGLMMREEGYTEKNPATIATVGDGFDLKVEPYYAKSLRIFLGGSVRHDLSLWDFYLQPEAHLGFRYDMFSNPVKLKAAFAYADTSGATVGPGTQFTITGPDPSQANFVAGGSLAATTDTWTLGFNFDFVKGSNGAIDEVGTVNLLGRI